MAEPNNKNLLDCLQLPGVIQGELEELLYWYYMHATGAMGGREIYLLKDTGQSPWSYKDDYALKLLYSQKGRLCAIRPGSQFTEEHLHELTAKINSELLVPVGDVYCPSVLFGANKVTGAWRYKDVFQLYPVSKGSPQLTQFNGSHPFILEVKVPKSTNHIIHGRRCAQKIREIGLLLNAVLEGSVLPIGNGYAKFSWVIVDSQEGKPQSVYAQHGYFADGLGVSGADFSDIAKFPAIKTVSPGEYYTRMGKSVMESDLEIPEDLVPLLDKYYGLSGDDKESFLLACYWFSHALNSYLDSRSASYVALVQAIEAFLPDSNNTCEKCGQPVYKLSQKFNDFLQLYAPTKSGCESGRKKLYALRSKISHGRRLMLSDLGCHRSWQDDGAWREMKQCVRVAFVNWLMAH